MYTLRLLVIAIVAAVFVGVAAAKHPTQAPSSYMGPSAETPPPGFGPSAPGPASNDCITPVSNTTDCLSFVQEGSNLTVPDKNCCPELAALVDNHAICLCQLLSGGLKSYGISIDLARALKLPSICRVSTPPVSTCSAAGYPVAAPTPSETSMPPAAGYPVAAPTPGEMSTPSGSSSSIAGSSVALFLGLAFACVSTYILLRQSSLACTPSSYMGPSAETPSPGFGPSAPGPISNDCITSLTNMSDCLSFAQEGSNLTLPDKKCCPELAGLVDSNPACLCQLVGGGLKSYGINIDLARALKLPSICRVSTPPVSMCSGAAPPPGEMSTPPGSASVPSTGNDKSEASSIAGSSVTLFLGLAFAAYLLTFF